MSLFCPCRFPQWIAHRPQLIACSVHQQQFVIEYLTIENKVLRETPGKKRILLTDDQRRRLVVRSKGLGQKLLGEIETLFTPHTILRRHRQLVLQKRDYTAGREKKTGRPRVRKGIVDLVLRVAKENPNWGYDRIQGALANVGFHIADTTVGNIFKAHGVEPAPDRKRTGSWKSFLKAHWGVLTAVDFTTVEVWTKSGLATFYLLFAMELKTRKIHLAGSTISPHKDWMELIAKNLTDFEWLLQGKKYLLHDCDAKFCSAFQQVLKNEGVTPLPLPPRSPKSERVYGEIHKEHQVGVLGEDNLLGQ